MTFIVTTTNPVPDQAQTYQSTLLGYGRSLNRDLFFEPQPIKDTQTAGAGWVKP